MRWPHRSHTFQVTPSRPMRYMEGPDGCPGTRSSSSSSSSGRGAGWRLRQALLCCCQLRPQGTPAHYPGHRGRHHHKGVCVELGWGFVTLGVLLIITAFLLGVIYFSIRTLPTSLELVETVPTYATALMVCCNGILLMFLYKRHEPVILLPTLVLCVVCVVLCLASTVLMVTKVVQTMANYAFCRYNAQFRQCHCYLISTQEVSEVYSVPQEEEYVYAGTPSCRVIQQDLYQFAMVQCILYALAMFFSLVGSVTVVFVFKQERDSLYAIQRDTDSEVTSICSSHGEPPGGSNDLFQFHNHHQGVFPHRIALPGLTSSLPRLVSQRFGEFWQGNQIPSSSNNSSETTPHIQEPHTVTVVNQRNEASEPNGGGGGRRGWFGRSRPSIPFSFLSGGWGSQRTRRRMRRRGRHPLTCHCRLCLVSGVSPSGPWFVPVPPYVYEPPPPYQPHMLPPYIEDDLVPAYRSRVGTPVQSMMDLSPDGLPTDPAPDYRSTVSTPSRQSRHSINNISQASSTPPRLSRNSVNNISQSSTPPRLPRYSTNSLSQSSSNSSRSSRHFASNHLQGQGVPNTPTSVSIQSLDRTQSSEHINEITGSNQGNGRDRTYLLLSSQHRTRSLGSLYASNNPMRQVNAPGSVSRSSTHINIDLPLVPVLARPPSSLASSSLSNIYETIAPILSEEREDELCDNSNGNSEVQASASSAVIPENVATVDGNKEQTTVSIPESLNGSNEQNNSEFVPSSPSRSTEALDISNEIPKPEPAEHTSNIDRDLESHSNTRAESDNNVIDEGGDSDGVEVYNALMDLHDNCARMLSDDNLESIPLLAEGITDMGDIESLGPDTGTTDTQETSLKVTIG